MRPAGSATPRSDITMESSHDLSMSMEGEGDEGEEEEDDTSDTNTSVSAVSDAGNYEATPPLLSIITSLDQVTFSFLFSF